MNEILDAVGGFEGSTCLDIGAFKGSWSKEIALRGGHSYAIEADIDNFKMLCKDLPSGITPCKYAISDKTEMQRFYWAKHPKSEDGSSQSNSLDISQLEKKEWADIHWDNVQCYTVDDFCERNKVEHLRFFNINFEGAEYDILGYVNQKWLDYTDSIYCSFHEIEGRVYDAHNIGVFLEKFGFYEHYQTRNETDKFLWLKE